MEQYLEKACPARLKQAELLLEFFIEEQFELEFEKFNRCSIGGFIKRLNSVRFVT